MLNRSTPLRQWAVLFSAATAVTLFLLLPWWRNHALLQDFYDYGLVMAAAGRIELGERPYVDFTTPIQTLQFLAAVLAERVWGARYLSLTYLNAAFIAASFVALTGLMRGRLGNVAALLVAAAIVMASSVQHTILWYNAMGVTWLAIIVWLAARMNSEGRAIPAKLVVIWGVLWLCGMTKLTYQIAALAFAGTLTVRAAFFKTIPWRTARLGLLGFVVFGVIAPVGTELIFTGASLEQWLENVVVSPARYRTEMLGQILTRDFYFQTPHDYYKPIHFSYAGAWGVVLLLVVAGALAAQAWKTEERRKIRLAFLAILVVGSWICGAVLLATNMDIAYLSGAAWLVLAVGLAETGVGSAARTSVRVIRVTLAVAAMSLLIPATLAAWRGTRALWGHGSLVRSELVTADDLPARFGYLKGMKVFPTLHESVLAFAAKRDALVAAGVPPEAFFFANGTEWMVRAFPETRHRGMPLWLAGGTTYSESEAWGIGERMERGADMQVVVSCVGWTYWYEGIQQSLTRSFSHDQLAPQIEVYTRRPPSEPVQLAINTQSNVYAGEMTLRGGPIALHVAANGLFYFGGPSSHRIDLASPVYRMSGEMVGELALDNAREFEAAFRVCAREGKTPTDVLWEEKVRIVPGERWFSRRFAVSTGGRPVTLQLQVPRDFPGNMGWRRLQIDHSGPLAGSGPWPMDRSLQPKPMGAAELKSLFGSEAIPVAVVEGYGAEIRSSVSVHGAELLSRGATELWFKVERPSSRVAGNFGLQESAWIKAGARIAVICYKSGRFDVLYRKDLTPQAELADRDSQHFEIGVPEGVAWVGLVVTPLEPEHPDAGDAWWRNVRVW